MGKTSPWLFTLALTGVFLTGCGGDDPEPSGTQSQNIDACKVVTQQDAASMFGKPASPHTPAVTADELILGECHWTGDTVADNQLLEIIVWDGADSYIDYPESEPFALGSRGNIRVLDGDDFQPGVIDVTWVQGSMTVWIGYAGLGANATTVSSRVEPMKTLARAASSKL